FQAEDGIRDFHVTGVQTCALPICFLDFNGEIFHSEEAILKASNRNFRYGDGVFESMRWENGSVSLLNFHAERLQKSMELLKMEGDRKSTRLNSSHVKTSYAVFCLQ